jgi:hypothetical protein
LDGGEIETTTPRLPAKRPRQPYKVLEESPALLAKKYIRGELELGGITSEEMTELANKLLLDFLELTESLLCSKRVIMLTQSVHLLITYAQMTSVSACHPHLWWITFAPFLWVVTAST